MLFNGNDDMARVADLGDPLKGTLNSHDFFASYVLLDDVGHEEKDRSQKKLNVDVTLDFSSGQRHKRSRVPDFFCNDKALIY